MDKDQKFELEYRRKKQWDIFSWASSILVAIVGGVIALETRAEKPHYLPWYYRLVLSGVVVILGWYSWKWILYNWNKETGMKDDEPTFGYVDVIRGLVIAALLAIWLPFFFATCSPPAQPTSTGRSVGPNSSP